MAVFPVETPGMTGDLPRKPIDVILTIVMSDQPRIIDK